MSAEENKALLRRFIDIWSTGNVATADEFISADLIDHSLPPGLPSGLAGFKLLVAGFRTAFPDLHVTIDDIVAQGGKAAGRVTFRGTHRGAFQGIPATGKQFMTTGIQIIRIADGKIAEAWSQPDTLGLLQQLGVVPMPELVA